MRQDKLAVGRTRPLGFAQRVIFVIALALILLAVGGYVTTLGGPPAESGWFRYAPLTSAAYQPDLPPWAQLLVWIGLICSWSFLSVLLLRPPRGPGHPAE